MTKSVSFPCSWLQECRSYSLFFYLSAKCLNNSQYVTHTFLPSCPSHPQFPPLTHFPPLTCKKKTLCYLHSILQIDRLEVSGLGQTPLSVSCGADGSFPGGEDGTPDPQRTKQAIAQLQQKILKLTEQIKIEQTARDDNVAEYLKLANNADKQQSTRIKQVKRARGGFNSYLLKLLFSFNR